MLPTQLEKTVTRAKLIINVLAVFSVLAGCNPENSKALNTSEKPTPTIAAKSGPVMRLPELVADRDNIQVREILSPSGVFCIVVNNAAHGIATQCDFDRRWKHNLK